MNHSEWVIRRTCIEKKSLSLNEAEEIIDHMAGRGIVLYWYKCFFCNRYHISKNSESKMVVETIGGNNENNKK